MNSQPEMTLQELAERWRVTKVTVWRWYESGKLNGRRRGPGKTSPIVVQLKDAEQFEREYNLTPNAS